MRSYDLLKRAWDVLVGGAALVASLPVQGIVGFLVRRQLITPIFFCQRRPDKDSKAFELVKFRTMLDVNESKGLVTDEQRITPFRAATLDELPSLLNSQVGDMILVGPRPLLVPYLERHAPEQARHNEVRPGNTYLARVNCRKALSSEDSAFVPRPKKMFLTLTKFFQGDMISADGDVTIPRLRERAEHG